MRSVREVTISATFDSDDGGAIEAAVLFLHPAAGSRTITLPDQSVRADTMRPTDTILVELVMAAIDMAAEMSERY